MQKNSFFACLAEKSCEARQKGASIRQELLITTVLQQKRTLFGLEGHHSPRTTAATLHTTAL